MPNEYHVYGIPGAGKTTYVSKKIKEAAQKYNPEQIIVSSFTRAAASELAGRDLPLPDENVGTLHSLCFHSLGQPVIAETRIQEFNAAYKHFALNATGVNLNEADGGMGEVRGAKNDAIFNSIMLKRARLVPQDQWTEHELSMHKAWEEFKEANNYCDFTDLIEFCLKDKAYPPHRAVVGFFDEAQDFTPMQLELIRMWSFQMYYVMLSGDDDQSIYSFIGADPEHLLKAELPQDKKLFLERSYRVPRQVQKVAEKIIQTVSVREPKQQKPKEENGEVVEGAVVKSSLTSKNGPGVRKFVENELASGKEVMILTTCSYMLNSIIAEFKKHAIPFWNKYKLDNGAWNPIKTGGKKVTTGDRIIAYANPKGPMFGQIRVWTPKQLNQWVSLCLSQNMLVRGAKKRIEEAAKAKLDDRQIFELLANSFKDDALDEAVKLDLAWLKEKMKPSKQKSAKYLLRLVDKHGLKILNKAPKVIVGTIHSVKGGQADTVLIFPDMSMASECSMFGADKQKHHDARARLFYVGVTRAKEKLVVGKPYGRLYFDLMRFV